MSERLALTQTPHNPNGLQEPLPPIIDAEIVEEPTRREPHEPQEPRLPVLDAEVVEEPATREPVVARYLGLADPSKNEAGSRQSSQQARQSGAYATGSSRTSQAQSRAHGSSQHAAWNLLNATLHTLTPDSGQSLAPTTTKPKTSEVTKNTEETKGEAKIDTPEQLRSAYQERINAIVSSRVDLKGLGYDEDTPLAQLHYLTILAANAMLERGFYIVPVAEQLRRAFKTDKDHYASLSAASFETLAKAEMTQQEDDAVRRELYAAASKYYDARTLQGNNYQWATRAELQAIIEAAKSSDIPPKLVDVRTKRWLGAKAVSLGAVFVPQFNRTQAVV